MNPNSKKGLPDLDLLVSWIAVIESGSVSDAATLLNISQAAVSQRIKQLETFFDTALLDRTTRPAQATAAGQRLFEHAKELLTQADQLVESVRGLSRAKRMTVRIGCVDSFAATVGPLLIKGLAGSSHQIRLWSGITPTLDASIEGRQLDLAVTTSLHGAAGIARASLFSEKFYAVLPAKFDLGPLGSLTEIERQLKFIRYSARSVIGQQVDDYLQRCGDVLERTYEFDTTDPLISLVANDMGFALTTPLCLWQSRQFLPDVRVVPMSAFTRHGRPYVDVSRTFYLAYRQGEMGTLPAEVRDLIRIAVRRQLSQDIALALGLGEEALLASEGGD